jgi:hypothetical protein
MRRIHFGVSCFALRVTRTYWRRPPVDQWCQVMCVVGGE